VLHLTLVFLGQTERDRVPAITSAVGSVVQTQSVYRTMVSGAGGHVPDRANAGRGGVAWLTLGEGFQQTASLSLAIDRALGSATYDERRRPRPHLTVARNINAEAVAALRDAAIAMTFEWATSRVVLFRSELGPGGSHYEPLATFDLRG
jgi:2'-5' RNA ligase